MENLNLAKSENRKTIKQHTDDLLRECKILRELYPDVLDKIEWEILELAIKFHDLGKVNSKFQNKLYKAINEALIEDYNKNSDEVPHNFLSPYFIDGPKYENIYGRENVNCLVSSVYYHHDREEIEYDEEEVKEDLNKQIKGLGEFYGLEVGKVAKRFGRYKMRTSNEEMKTKKYIMIKGFLNKLDYVASLDKENVHVEESVFDEDGKSVENKVSDIIEFKYNGKYREVQKYMKKKQNENIIVVSPCGSGKTEAALLWIGASKAFYTLPLKVSINAIYERIKNNVGYNKTLLLHSDAMGYYLDNKKEAEINAYERARRLSSPLLITTCDQIFKMIFRYNGYEEILSTFSYAKLVIDEIQMYSPDMIAYILIGLKMIDEIGGKFAIMTATFPPILYDFLDLLKVPYVRHKENFKPNIERRHKISVLKDEEIDVDKVKEFSKTKKVLVIVNTVKKAQELYEKLKNENVHLLHSHFLKGDRKKLEDSIMEFSGEDQARYLDFDTDC